MHVCHLVSQPRLAPAPRRVVCSVADATAAVHAARPAFDIRPSQVREELERAAWLRADAYYENRSVGRFKASFIKQFAGQELYSLLRRTKGPQAECIALIATCPSSTSTSAGGSSAQTGGCIGTLDVRRLDAASQFGNVWPEGVPLPPSTPPASGDAPPPLPAAYISNVVVAPSQRRRGLGRQLVAEGMQQAQQVWGAGLVYCHVEVDNEPAMALYLGCGFQQLGPELPPDDMGLGKRLLLCCDVSPQ